jgi:hypothetical protein
VYVTDKGIVPKIVNANPGDRIWWIWDEAKKPQNVVQVGDSIDHVHYMTMVVARRLGGISHLSPLLGRIKSFDRRPMAHD